MNIVEREDWRAIPGFTGYEASRLGRIRSLDRTVPLRSRVGTMTEKTIKGRVLRARLNRDGYFQLYLFRNTVTVHKAIVLAFIGHIPKGCRSTTKMA